MSGPFSKSGEQEEKELLLQDEGFPEYGGTAAAAAAVPNQVAAPQMYAAAFAAMGAASSVAAAAAAKAASNPAEKAFDSGMRQFVCVEIKGALQTMLGGLLVWMQGAAALPCSS